MNIRHGRSEAPVTGAEEPRGLSFRVKAVAAAATLALIGATVAIVLAVRSGGDAERVVTRLPSWNGQLSAPHGPPVPARGAYFGAWTLPEPFTQQGRITSIARFESHAGRRLDIVHTYLRWDDPFPRYSDQWFVDHGYYLLLSWASTDTHAIESGAVDDVIRQRADAIAALRRPIFLEWRWEMDRPNLTDVVHSPGDYIRAWRHIRRIFAEEHATNVGWVWCPTAKGFLDGTAQRYYPGDDEVDWLCTDAYPDEAFGRQDYQGLGQLLQPLMRWASHRAKPVLVGEFGVPQSYSDAERARWLLQAGQIIQRTPQIKGLVYFDANPPGNPASIAYAIGSSGDVVSALHDLGSNPYFRPRRKLE